MVKKIIVDRHFFWAEICEENKQNLQICHVTASATRVNQGVEPWVSQQPLAKLGVRGRAERPPDGHRDGGATQSKAAGASPAALHLSNSPCIVIPTPSAAEAGGICFLGRGPRRQPQAPRRNARQTTASP